MLSEPPDGCCSIQQRDKRNNVRREPQQNGSKIDATELPFNQEIGPSSHSSFLSRLSSLNTTQQSNQNQQNHQTESGGGISTSNQNIGYTSVLTTLLGNNYGGRYHRKWRRQHGLQTPLHPLQVIGWLTLGISAAGSFLILIPAIKSPIIRVTTGAILTSFYVLHAATHLGALLLDPAESQLRAIDPKTSPIPEFDRTKHAHVIENGRCHLCNIHTTGARTKHCAVCNKCVARFDHHCKWLNQCVGGRNYSAFLMCVATAVAAAITVAILALTEIILYYVQPHWLILWDNNVDNILTTTPSIITTTTTNIETTTTNSIPLQSTTNSPPPPPLGLLSGDVAFLIVVGILGLLAAITAGLLLHLCFFHVYISFLGLTTYEYIRNQRQTQTNHQINNQSGILDSNTNISSGPPICRNSVAPGVYSTSDRRPDTLHCCRGANTSTTNTRMSYYACAYLENRTESCNACLINRTNHNLNEVPGIGNGVPEERITTTSKMYTLEEETSKEEMNSSENSPARKIRTQRKWNCCISVPDSPDDPTSTESLRNSSTTSATVHKTKCLLSLCKYKPSKTKSLALSAQQVSLTASSTTVSTHANLDEDPATNVRSGTGTRIRVLFRVFGHWTHGRRHRNQRDLNPIPVGGQIVRNNQVVPLPLEGSNNTDSVQLVRPCTTTAHPIPQTPQTDPFPRRSLRLPALPPPPRRRLSSYGNNTQYEDFMLQNSGTNTNNQMLVDALSLIPLSSVGPCQVRQFRAPPHYRRRKRSVVHHRPKTPTLSPIRESGLSNPASPSRQSEINYSIVGTTENE